MVDNENQGDVTMSFSTMPAYEQIKQKIVVQLSIAENNYANYVGRPTDISEKKCRTSLHKLVIGVSEYFYLLESSDEKDYVSFFVANPDKWDDIHNLGAVLTLAKQVIYKLGITQIESAKLPVFESYKELE